MDATMWMEEEVERLVTERLPAWIEKRPSLRSRLQEVIGAGTVPSTRRMTYEEFLEWADEDTLAEWIAIPDTDLGEVVMASPASAKHQLIGDFLLKALGTYVEVHDLGLVLSAPFQMRLEQSGREPDLLFVATEHLGRLKETHLDGPADLVVEIVSPESAGRDRGEKYYEYEQGGVTEYWLIDPLRRQFEAYCLDGDGLYRLAFGGAEGRYDSQVLSSFWLRVEWLWQEPLPNPLRVLGKIAGVDAGLLEQFLKALGGTG